MLHLILCNGFFIFAYELKNDHKISIAIITDTFEVTVLILYLVQVRNGGGCCHIEHLARIPGISL